MSKLDPFFGAAIVFFADGSALPQRSGVDVVGDGVTIVDDPGNGRTKITIPGTNITVQSEGVSVTQRNVLNLIGAGFSVVDDAINGRTNITLEVTEPDLGDVVELYVTSGIADAPSVPVGISAGRGSEDGVTDRDGSMLVWDESISAFRASKNDAGDVATLTGDLPIQASSFWGSGDTAVAASGQFRGPSAVTLVAARNQADDGDIVALATDADDNVLIGGTSLIPSSRTVTFPAGGTATIAHAKRSGTGANAGDALTIAAEDGQDVSGGTNNDGGALVLVGGKPGTGGTGGSAGAVRLRSGDDVIGDWTAVGFALDPSRASLAIVANEASQELYFQAALGVTYFDSPTLKLRDGSQAEALVFALDGDGATSVTAASDATFTLRQAQRSGTGANDGTAFSIVAQQGQDQTGGADNNNGAFLDLKGGKAGTGGAGAAGDTGAVRLFTGDSHMLTIGHYPGIPNVGYFANGADATGGFVFGGGSLISFLATSVQFVGATSVCNGTNGGGVFTFTNNYAAANQLLIGADTTAFTFTQTQRTVADTAGADWLLQAQMGKGQARGGHFAIKSGEVDSGLFGEPLAGTVPGDVTMSTSDDNQIWIKGDGDMAVSAEHDLSIAAGNNATLEGAGTLALSTVGGDLSLTAAAGPSITVYGDGGIDVSATGGDGLLLYSDIAININSDNDITFDDTVIVGTGGITLVDDAGDLSIKYQDVTTASADGWDLTIQAQNATGPTSTGGNLFLKAGTGTSSSGELYLTSGSSIRMTVNSTGVGFNSATPIARPDYTVTNPTTDRSLNVTGDTLAQVAAVLGTLIADLISYGLLQ